MKSLLKIIAFIFLLPFLWMIVAAYIKWEREYWKQVGDDYEKPSEEDMEKITEAVLGTDRQV